MTDIAVKTCSKCNVAKPLSEFYLRQYIMYYEPICKSCRRAQKRAFHRKRQDAIARARRGWTLTQRDKQLLDSAERDREARRKYDWARRGTKNRDASKEKRYPVEPFRNWICETFSGASAVQIGKALAMNERTVRAVLNGELRTISLYAVDRALVTYGHPEILQTLYTA
jgi:hypothetical protein